MSKLVKFMGTEDRFVLPKGTDFDGRLATATTKQVVFDKSNKWVVDVDDDSVGLSSDAVELLLEDPLFQDVTGKERVPSNEHQKMFLGHGATRPLSNKEKEAAAADEDAPATSGRKRGGGSSTAGGGTTVGGSTPGD